MSYRLVHPNIVSLYDFGRTPDGLGHGTDMMKMAGGVNLGTEEHGGASAAMARARRP